MQNDAKNQEHLCRGLTSHTIDGLPHVYCPVHSRVHAPGNLVQKVGETVNQALPGDEVPGSDERDDVSPWSMTFMAWLCLNTLGVIF